MLGRILMKAIVAALLVLSGSGDADAVMSDAELLRELDAASDVETRAGLVYSLQDRRSQPVRKALEKIAADPGEESQVRMMAICSLGGSATRASVPVLLKIVETDLEERHGFWGCAIPLLGYLNDRRAVPLLVRIANLNEEHLAGMDHMAIEALARLADERELAVLSAKVHVLPVRLAVMEGLARIASPRSTEILITGLTEGEEPEVVKAAEEGLLKIGKRAIPAVKTALAQYESKETRSRLGAVLRRIQAAD